MATVVSHTISRPFTSCIAGSRPRLSASRRLVTVRASSVSSEPTRRALLYALLAPVVLRVPTASALIPDEEDEEMVERAKANRASRLAKNKEATRELVREEGFKNQQLDQQLVPVQKAVFKLATSGTQLESGDIKGASATLSEPWVADLEKVSGILNASDASKATYEKLIAELTSLKTAADKGDLQASKQDFVAVVSAVQEWTTAVGVAAKLKGL